jgi:hypothetical protein
VSSTKKKLVRRIHLLFDHPTAERWLDIFSLALVGAFIANAFQILFAQKLSALVFETRHVSFCVIANAIVLAPICYLVPIRLNHFRTAFRYPSLWTAGIIGTVGLELAVHDKGLLKYPAFVVFSTFVSVLVAQMVLALKRYYSDFTFKYAGDVQERETPIKTPAEDEFSRVPIAKRLAEFLRADKGTIGIIGPFGSGKTSLANMVQYELTRHKTLWFCPISVWGFETSTAAAQKILSDVVELVSAHADCSSIRDLPDAYSRAVYGTGVKWLSTLTSAMAPSTDPVKQLVRLTRVLIALNARVVLIVEDIDRNQSTRFDPKDIEALLHRIKNETHRISFILTGGIKTDISFSKLCDHIESLDNLPYDEVWNKVYSFRHSLRSRFPTDIPIGGEENCWRDMSEHLKALRDTRSPTIENAMIWLLSNPRTLKHVLNRTKRCWVTLHGEIDIDDLLAASALRLAAPPAFDFLLRHHSTLHERDSVFGDDGREQRRRLEVAEADWNLLARREWRNAEWNVKAAGIVVSFLAPRFDIDRSSLFQYRTAVQGIQQDREVYWQRVLREDLDDSVSDQYVLGLIKEWDERTSYEIVQEFVRRDPLKGFFGALRHFIERMSEERLLAFGTKVFEELPQETPQDLQYIYILHDAIRHRVKPERALEWLQSEMKMSIGRSLQTYEFLSSWTIGFKGFIVTTDQRDEIRKITLAYARQLFGREPAMLARVLGKGDIHVLAKFMSWIENEHHRRPIRPEEWVWLRQPIVESLASNPKDVVPQVAALLAKTESGKFTLNDEMLTVILGEESAIIVEAIATMSLPEEIDDDDKQILNALVSAARLRLKSHTSSQGL